MGDSYYGNPGATMNLSDAMASVRGQRAELPANDIPAVQKVTDSGMPLLSTALNKAVTNKVNQALE